MIVLYRIYEFLFCFACSWFLIKSTIDGVKNLKKGESEIKFAYKEIETKKVCTKSQPFRINEKFGVICNFNCDGDCMFFKDGKVDVDFIFKEYGEEYVFEHGEIIREK